MKEYEVKLNGMIYRRADGAWIPPDEGNADYQEYQAWLALGNTPDHEGAPSQQGSPP